MTVSVFSVTSEAKSSFADIYFQSCHTHSCVDHNFEIEKYECLLRRGDIYLNCGDGGMGEGGPGIPCTKAWEPNRRTITIFLQLDDGVYVWTGMREEAGVVFRIG